MSVCVSVCHQPTDLIYGPILMNDTSNDAELCLVVHSLSVFYNLLFVWGGLKDIRFSGRCNRTVGPVFVVHQLCGVV